MDAAAWHVMRWGGIQEQENYPYTGNPGICNTAQYTGAANVRVKAVHNTTRRSEMQLLAAISRGPVAVAVDLSSAAFMQYGSGIISSASCGTAVAHAVTAVGYGTDYLTGQKYYKVRNSWGSAWGENGYVRILRNGDGDGICGI